VWNDYEHPCGRIWDELKKAFPEKLELRKSGTRQAFGRIPHFLTVGDAAYRLEMPHPPYDDMEFTDISPETKAEICFNNEEFTKSLKGLFEAVWSRCPLVPAPEAPHPVE
jgi:hypothetical protein